jgi:hypothetical protein
MKSSLPLVCAFAGLLAACGSKKTQEETTTTTTAPATTPPTETAAPVEAPATATAAPAATFDLNAVPVSTATLGAFPYLSGMKGYKINVPSDSVDFDFERSYVFDGKNLIPVEGHVLRREYVPINSDKKASELMMQRTYADLVKSLGGVLVFSGPVPEDALKKVGEDEYHKHDGRVYSHEAMDTYVIRQKDKQIWVQVHPSDYKLNVNVTETGAMPQTATATPAAELKKN